MRHRMRAKRSQRRRTPWWSGDVAGKKSNRQAEEGVKMVPHKEREMMLVPIDRWIDSLAQLLRARGVFCEVLRCAILIDVLFCLVCIRCCDICLSVILMCFFFC